MHFTHDMNDFVKYVPLDDQFTISTANGVTAVEGYGTVILNCPDNVGRLRYAHVTHFPYLQIEWANSGCASSNPTTHRLSHPEVGARTTVFLESLADSTRRLRCTLAPAFLHLGSRQLSIAPFRVSANPVLNRFSTIITKWDIPLTSHHFYHFSSICSYFIQPTAPCRAQGLTQIPQMGCE